MNTKNINALAYSPKSTLLICGAAMISLAIAMGIGRFAFTPMLPLMVTDGLLDYDTGALIAAGNYFGYLVGALLAAQILIRQTTLLSIGLLSTAVLTALVGLSTSVPIWFVLRFLAGVASAWTLVATSAWALGWLSILGRPNLAGSIFSGVGIGITLVGVICLKMPTDQYDSLTLWIALGGIATLLLIAPTFICQRWANPEIKEHDFASTQTKTPKVPNGYWGLIICYSLFGFGYILPATFLPTQGREIIGDPQVFGLVWPLFGIVAASSTILSSYALKKFDRLHIWAACQLIMSVGVFLPTIWTSLISVSIAAVLVGGTFMVITMTAMQEASSRALGNPRVLLGLMTAGFAIGQLMGPVVSSVIGLFTDDFLLSLTISLSLAATGLLASAVYLGWQGILQSKERSTNER